jgi:uncharacterized repeat protein (TIGR01451 family)
LHHIVCPSGLICNHSFIICIPYKGIAFLSTLVYTYAYREVVFAAYFLMGGTSMNRFAIVIGTAVAAVALTLAVAAPAYAWHPKGVINKSVQNVTAGGALSDANATNTAISAKPGDVLRYVITVSNAGKPDSRGYNDMAKTVMTDTLPAGVELVSNPATRSLKVDLGLIKPGQKVTKEYQVKVVAKQDGAITNTACFTGNSTANDSPQKGCDTAVATVKIPPVTPPTTPNPTPTPQPTPPATPVAPQQPTVLPSTGISNILLPATLVSIVAFAAHRLHIKRQTI